MTSMTGIGGTTTRRTVLKGLGAGAGLVAAGLSLPALGQSKRSDLRVGIFGGDIGNLSPVIRWDISAGLLMYHIFDPLTRVDFQNRKIVPWLAEEWANPDPLTWRIRLKRGVKWHGGYGEMTAEDVAYTWRYHLDTNSFQVGTALFPIDTITTEGDDVLEVKTKLPFAAFPGVSMGYGGMIVSRNAHQEIGNDAFGITPVGSGPYMVDSVRGNSIELVKNPEYWREGYPKLDRLSYQSIPDSNVRLQVLQNGEIDFMTHPDPKDVAGIQGDPGYTVTSVPGWNWDYQAFNVVNPDQPDAPWLNKLVRQAISYAIDREAIVQEIYNGQATATDNQIPPGYLGHQQSMLKYPVNGDLEKARELIAQAGLQGYEVEVITSDKDWLRRELELVGAMVSQIGINYKIRNLDIGGYNNLWINKKHQQALEDITLVSPDPDSTSWWFMHSKGSVSAYGTPEMDSLLDSARAESDQSRRSELYHQVTSAALEECPLIYHCNVNYVRIFNSELRGFSPAPQEYTEMLDEVFWA